MTRQVDRATLRRRIVAVAVVAAALAGQWFSWRRAERPANAPIGPAWAHPRAAQANGGPQATPPGKSQPTDDREAARALGLLNAVSVDVGAVRAAIEKGWTPPAPEPAPARQAVPKAPKLRRANAAALERKFRLMPADGDWERESKRTVEAQRVRLGRIGLQLVGAECRRDVCRFELVLTGARAERRRQRFGGQSRTLATDQSAVHTTFEPSGAVRSVVYLGRKGPLSLG